MASELVRQLVDAGVHFGHRASRWNPKMAPFIFGKRNTIHIIDIRETVRGLLRAKRFLSQVVAKGQDVLFVGTKRQARLPVQQAARHCGMPFVTERWLGGTLTNFRTIRSRLARLEELERAESDGTAFEYSKKMIAMRSRERSKIERNLAGIREMGRLPGALIVVDVQRERNALREAKTLQIPTICLIDTDSDPDFADVPIPGNDDAIRGISIVLQHLADAVEEGKKGRLVEQPAEKQGAQRGPRGRGRRGAGGSDDGSPESLAARADDRDRVPGADGSESRPKSGRSAELSPAAASDKDRPS